MAKKDSKPRIKITKSSVIDENNSNKIITKYFMDLPEYQSPIIIMEEHIEEVSKQINLLIKK